MTRAPRRRGAWRSPASAILAIATLALSACASSSSFSSVSSGSTNNGDTGNSKVKLMVITDVASAALALPQVVTGAQAAVNRINAAGGVNGHQLQLLSCNSQANPNDAAACAREAVADKVSP
jgi:Periplasmic binding protein